MFTLISAALCFVQNYQYNQFTSAFVTDNTMIINADYKYLIRRRNRFSNSVPNNERNQTRTSKMATNSGKGTLTQIPRDDLRGLIELIASDVHIKVYKIVFKQQEFTGDNFCGEILRIQIIPIKSDEKTLNLIVKTAPSGGSTRITLPIRNMYIVELFIYIKGR